MSPVVSTVSALVASPREATFDLVVPVDLTRIFRGFGPLPAVVATEDQTGAWDAPGQTRTVRLSDGSTAREELTAHDRPEHFAYRVSGFTGPLRFLTTGALGDWWFEDADGGTAVRWRYAFEPRTALARPVLWAVVRPLWRRYMAAALAATRSLVEQAEAPRPAATP